MRIALDGTPLTVPSGGVPRYTEELARALAVAFPDDSFQLVSDQPFEHPLRMPADDSSLFAGRWWSWRLPRLLKRNRIDLFHGTEFAVPYLPVIPSVLSLHDLSPWLNEAWHSGADRVRRRTPWLIRLHAATMVITMTEAVRRQAIAHFRIEPARVAVTPLAAADHFRPVLDAPAATPYFVYVGTIEPRKNVPMLVEAWREIRRTHPGVRLVIAGRRRADGQEIESEPGLDVFGLTPDSELPALYSGAVAALYPSFYEGFGLPVLEAMQCGAAVIASKDPAVMEVSGGAAMHCDARSPGEWIAAMTALLESESLCADYQARSLTRAAEFSWERTARLTREVYDEAQRRFRA